MACCSFQLLYYLLKLALTELSSCHFLPPTFSVLAHKSQLMNTYWLYRYYYHFLVQLAICANVPLNTKQTKPSCADVLLNTIQTNKLYIILMSGKPPNTIKSHTSHIELHYGFVLKLAVFSHIVEYYNSRRYGIYIIHHGNFLCHFESGAFIFDFESNVFIGYVDRNKFIGWFTNAYSFYSTNVTDGISTASRGQDDISCYSVSMQNLYSMSFYHNRCN